MAAAVLCAGASLTRANVRAQDRREGTGLTAFADANYRGPNATYMQDTEDLHKSNMNDRIDSIRIGRGETWEVCEDTNYKGRCRVFSEDVPDLKKLSWGGRISSLRKVDDARAHLPELMGQIDPLPPRIVLFDAPGYAGKSVAMSGASENLGSWGNKTGSVKVYGGAWELCDGDRFRGKCQTVTDSVADLSVLNLKDKVSSLRPVSPR